LPDESTHGAAKKGRLSKAAARISIPLIAVFGCIMDSLRPLEQVQEIPEKASPYSWRPPPVALELQNDEVHVWRATLDLPIGQVWGLLNLLSADERRTAERFHFQTHRNRYIIGRGLLRTILSRYLNSAPGRLRFCYGPYGKPSLVEAYGEETLSFNVSHSRDLALFAVTRGRALGVDIEHVAADLASQQLAERFFSPREVAVLRTLPVHLRQEGFFTCWTRKEAYLKARGEGLMLALEQFEVSLIPGEPAALRYTQEGPQEASRWSLQDLFPGPEYVAALAVEGHEWRLSCWQWPQ